MKEQLELKLSEVNDLVSELGALPEKVARRSSQRRRREGLVPESVKTNEDRPLRQRQTLHEQDGALPAILEDKYYPRRTLDANEINIVRDEAGIDSLESPDLGPPPVAHFDESEALTFNAARSPRRTSTELIEESERLSTLNANLESRRKRRTSILLPSSALGEQKLDDEDKKVHEPEKEDAPSRQPSILKSGAKRKLDVSELEDTSRISKELDDFIFQRRQASTTTAVKSSRFSRPPGRQEQENVEQSEVRPPERPQTTRKILAPKSTNSPAKRRIDVLEDKPKAESDAAANHKPERRLVSRVRTRPVAVEIPPQIQQASRPVVDIPVDEDRDQSHMPPKTPAAELDDVMSPISTEPSTKQRQPKEMAVTNSVEDVLNGSIGRGSKRARSAVNYAPPKLNTKLRRPGKELVGAIEGMTKIQNDGQQQLHVRSNSVELNSARQAQPAAFGTSQGGKSEPASPLRDKQAPPARKSGPIEDELRDAVSRLSVYDPPNSSPAVPPAEHLNKFPDAQASEKVSKARRQSAHPASMQDTIEVMPTGGLLRTRRPSSAMSIRQSEDQTEGHKRHMKSASVSSLPTTAQSSVRTNTAARSRARADVTDNAQLAPTGVLSRRKSMMI